METTAIGGIIQIEGREAPLTVRINAGKSPYNVGEYPIITKNMPNYKVKCR